MVVQGIMARLLWIGQCSPSFLAPAYLHDGYAPFGTTLRKRTTSLLVPFFIYNIFYNLAFVGAEAMGWTNFGICENNFQSICALPLRSPAFQLYFLAYLFLISTGVCGLDKLAQKSRKWAYLTVFGLIMAFYVVEGYPQMSHGADYHCLPMYLAMFLTGVVCRPFIEKPFAGPWTIGAALGLVLTILVVFHFNELSLLVPPLLTALARTILEIRQLGLLLCIGEMSGSIYVWHTPLLLPAITRLLAHSGIPSLVNLFGSILLTLAICMLLRVGLDTLFVRVLKRNPPRYITL